MREDIKERIKKILEGCKIEGYKKEGGYFLPTEWELVPLKSCFDRITRKNEEHIENVLTISAQFGLINQNDFFKKIIASKDKENYYLIKRGEFAYNKSYSSRYPYGSIKRLDLYEEGIVSPLYICMKCKRKGMGDYFEQYFESGLLNGEIRKYAQEGARNHGLLNIAIEDFFNSKVIIPSLEEQNEITKILFLYDKKTKLLSSKIHLLKNRRKYLFKKLVDDNAGNYTRESVLLEELIEKYVENTVVNNQYPVLTSSRKGIFYQKDYYRDEVASEDTTGYNVVPYGYFTYRHMSDDLIFKFNINDIVENGIVSTLYPVFRVKKRIDKYYLQFVLNEGKDFKKFALIHKQGGSRTYMYFDELCKLRISIPDLDVQKRIVNLLKAADDEITLLEKQFELVKQEKKALMQLLFAGIVRVNKM